ncbi:hypothetical protein C7P50_09280 [Salmonella enterica subsp. enterica serovar Typhimurium]|nr:hypothetical protein [Salmonella enterica subsp. enterica serovar Typhimurium]EGI2854621.1 hypothetical protein [Salmonella enterica subsp. enterica serovar Typhimurium]EIK3716641.1 hypothetical protein [Salmonella enterica subsp. enterica serovar Typhimurium]EJX3352947.1 hypothetical protein [Salmonella enterica subsp. enterica serovar Typhimurium]EKF5939403.1 hypothetical protein [Salmonella enterica subsp. enterica serovar Typhimurium]
MLKSRASYVFVLCSLVMRDIHSAAVLPVVLSVLLLVLDLLVVSFATPVGKLGEFMILLNLTGVIYWFCVNLFNRLREVLE